MNTKEVLIIGLLVFSILIVPFGNMTYEAYLQNNCKIEALKANKSTEDIVRLCR